MITAITLSTFVIFTLVILGLILFVGFSHAFSEKSSNEQQIVELRKLANLKRNYWNDEAAALEVELTIQKLLADQQRA